MYVNAMYKNESKQIMLLHKDVTHHRHALIRFACLKAI